MEKKFTIETAKAQAEMEDSDQKIHAESLVKRSWTWTSEDCRQEMHAPGLFVKLSHTLGADLAGQNAFGKTYGTQHSRRDSSLPLPLHVPKMKAATEEEGEEDDVEQRKSASRESRPPAPGGRNGNGAGEGGGARVFSTRNGEMNVEVGESNRSNTRRKEKWYHPRENDYRNACADLIVFE